MCSVWVDVRRVGLINEATKEWNLFVCVWMLGVAFVECLLTMLTGWFVV